MDLLFRSFLRPILWALTPLAQEGQPGDLDPDLPWVTPGGTPTPRGGPAGGHPTPDPTRRIRCREAIARNAKLSVKCREQGKNYQPGADECKPGKCVDKGCTRQQLAENGARAKRCRDGGGTWKPTGQCTGNCEPGPGPGPGPRPGPGPAPPPPGQPVSEPVRRELERIKRILGKGEKVTPQALLKAAEEEGAAFDPMIDQPPPLPAPSLSDVLADPRFLSAAADASRRIRGGASAAGVRGGPVLSAVDESARNLLGPMSNLIFGQDLETGRYNLGRGQDTYNRLAGNWQRWWEPTRYATDYPLRVGALSLGAGQLGLTADDQRFRHWWLPESQQRSFGEARYHAGQGNLMSLINALAGAQYGGIAQPGWS